MMDFTELEDPRKADLRDRTKLALRSSGHDVLEQLSPAELPANAGLKGAILGDVQAYDPAGTLCAYYVRPEWDHALPTWLGNLSLVAQGMENVRVCVVVDNVSAIMERTARASGASLLRIAGDEIFHLEAVVEATEFETNRRLARHREKVRKVRRVLEESLDQRIGEARESYPKFRDLTRQMPPARREQYVAAVDDLVTKVREWGERLSQRLDEVAASGDEGELNAIRQQVEEGP
jgi:stress-induced morphogen